MQEIVIAGGFTPFTDYHVFITDKFENVEHLEVTANYSGNLIITVSDLPNGMFMHFSGSYSFQVFEEVVEGESCPVQPTGEPVVMEFCSGSYDCIEVSFQENEDDTVSQTIPDCDAEQTEIDEPFTAPQPYENSFCPAVKKCIGIKSNGSDTKVLNEKGLFVEVPTGPEGPSGPAGADGADGLSAYEVAVANGYVGTEADWLLSLKGDTGATGAQGPQGPQGATGATGEDSSVLLASSTSDYSTSSTSEVLLKSEMIPGGTVTVSKIKTICARFRKSGGAGTVKPIIRIHTSAVAGAGHQIVPGGSFAAGTRFVNYLKEGFVKSATDTEFGAPGVVNDYTNSNAVASSYNIDWTVDQYVNFCGLVGNASDILYLSGYKITLE